MKMQYKNALSPDKNAQQIEVMEFGL